FQMPALREAAEEIDEVDEAEEVVLEPQDDFVLVASGVDDMFLLEESVAHAQEFLVAAVGKPARALLEEIVVRQRSLDGSADHRLAKRKMTSGKIRAAGARRDAVAVMDMEHTERILVSRAPTQRNPAFCSANAARARGAGGDIECRNLQQRHRRRVR